MANWFYLTLDTTGPANPTISIEGGAAYTADQLVDLTIGTGDGTTAGYQMLLWGAVDIAHDANVQTLMGDSVWITYNTTKQIKLSTGDGSKTVYMKLRDSVWNESSQVDESIILDQTMPVADITGPDLSVISKISTKDTSAFSFSVDQDFVEYKVKVVGTTGAAHDTGTLIPTTAGSTNMSGTGTYPSATPINCQIKGADLETASSGDNQKIVKVFVKDAAGNWSS